MTSHFLSLAIVAVTCAKGLVHGFSVSPTPMINSGYGAKSTVTELKALIEAVLETDEVFEDPGLARVQQAKEYIAILQGSVQTNESEINPVAEGLKLYTKLVPLSDQNEVKGTVLCKGMGTEVYTDPGSSTQRLVTLATTDAVKDALSAMDASPSSGKLLITFAGGDDLMIHEVLQGVEMMTSGLNLGSDTTIEFRSLCHQSFPLEKCGVAALDVNEDHGEGVYWHDGQWWSVSEEDFTAIM